MKLAFGVSFFFLSLKEEKPLPRFNRKENKIMKDS